MEIFKRLHKQKSETDNKERTATEAAARAEELLSELRSALDTEAERNDGNNLISLSSLSKYREKVAELDVYLKEHPVRHLDTTEIDKELALIAEQTKEAVETDMPQALEQGIRALSEGIREYRADIKKWAQEYMSTTVEYRVYLLRTLELAVDAAGCADSVRRKLQTMRELQEKYRAEWAKLDEELEEFPNGEWLVTLMREPVNEEEKAFLRHQMERADLNAYLEKAELFSKMMASDVEGCEIVIELTEMARQRARKTEQFARRHD